MNQAELEVNVSRYLYNSLKTLGTSLGVPAKTSEIRLPFNPQEEDEAMIYRFLGVRNPPKRQSVYQGIFAWEVHCWTKRGDLRADHKTDRHLWLAGRVRDLYRDDIMIYDALGGNTNSVCGVLQGLQTQLHLRDKRNTIFGADVDYSVETPTTMQAVVSVTGLFLTSI